MTNKEKYLIFCENTYIPIYSKPWWLDAVCGEDNWDVWVYENDHNVEAAMPYYLEVRGAYKYITKAPLTQNNGIIFKYAKDAKLLSKTKFEEKVINEACEFISSLNIDVYEQQFQPEFTNWLPFFWNQYTETTRYTYQIDDMRDMNIVWNNFDNSRRNQIKKGMKNAEYIIVDDIRQFYLEHEKIFLKQGLACPFSYELWEKLVQACKKHESGRMMVAKTPEGKIASLSFLVWDEKKAYHLVGGGIPELQNLDTFSTITWLEMQLAHEKGLTYDFEGSVIKRIAKVYQKYGAMPKPYFRIRKVFNPDILRAEVEDFIKRNSAN